VRDVVEWKVPLGTRRLEIVKVSQDAPAELLAS
jgi:hypothetical protein